MPARSLLFRSSCKPPLCSCSIWLTRTQVTTRWRPAAPSAQPVRRVAQVASEQAASASSSAFVKSPLTCYGPRSGRIFYFILAELGSQFERFVTPLMRPRPAMSLQPRNPACFVEDIVPRPRFRPRLASESFYNRLLKQDIEGKLSCAFATLARSSTRFWRS